MAGFRWQVEASTDLGPSTLWLPAANPVTGTDGFVELIHDLPPGVKVVPHYDRTELIERTLHTVRQNMIEGNFDETENQDWLLLWLMS